MNTGHRHVWFFWAKLAKTVKAAHVARFSGHIGTSPATVHTLTLELDDVIPDFPYVIMGGMASLEHSGEIPERRSDLPVDDRPMPGGDSPGIGSPHSPNHLN